VSLDWSDLTGRTALVTGAASGIGRESALAFARRGAHLVLCDLNAQGLDETAAAIRALGRGQVATHVVDVADAAQMGRFADAVHARVPAVDVLMNNAGVAIGGGFLDTSLADWDWILAINVKGVVHGCHYFVPAMIRRGAGGQVINVASAAGYVSSAMLAAYATTKFGVVGLSEALREELAPYGIGVTCICPGIIDTPITRSARMLGKSGTKRARKRLVEAYQKRGYGPERVATGVLRAASRNRGIAPITPEAWIMYYFKRFAPGLLARLNAVLTRRQRRELEQLAD
jgi:NAD(P)-dependent dehydrogenase (short-subunit alcohol dehydrogenase family)